MTDTTTPMDPELLEAIRYLVKHKITLAEAPSGMTALTELLEAHDRWCADAKRLRNDLDLYDRARLSDLRAQAERTCERRTSERDALKTKAHDLAMRLITAECALADEQRERIQDRQRRQRRGDVARSEGWTLASVARREADDFGIDPPPDEAVAREQLVRLLRAFWPDDDQAAYCLDPVGTVASVDRAVDLLSELRGEPPDDDAHVGCSPTSHCGSCEHAENDS